MKECILLAHAFPGCDKTSAIYKKGKKGPWRILEKDRDLQIMLNKIVARQKVSAKFDLLVPPPTSDAARLHSLRVYHQIQQWMGRNLDPISWGWSEVGGVLTPVPAHLPPAPDSLLCLITCNCRKECSRSCDCKRSDLPCSVMCANCRGRDCTNSPKVTDSDGDEDDNGDN